MSRKIFILGSSGFIGKCLLEKFLRDTSENVIGYSSKECNLLSEDAIYSALSSVNEQDVIIMVSAITRLTENSFDAMIKNIQMIENLCCFVEKYYVSQVIFFSSVEIYGYVSDSVIITEDILPNPNNYYAISKLVSEYLLKKELNSKNIPLTIFRLPGIYGHGDDGKSTINALVTSAMTNGKIIIYGDGSDKRDFVYVNDIFKLTIESIRKKTDITVNVATGKSYSIKEIANIIIKELDNNCSLEYKIPQLTGRRAKYMIYNINKLLKSFPDIIFTDIKEGIAIYLK